MPRKKLTPKLKEKIKKDYKSLKKSEYTGAALSYLNKVKGAAKARAVKKEYHITVGSFKVDKRTGLYRWIESGAKSKGLSVKQFIKENEAALLRLRENFKTYETTHLDKLESTVEALPDNKKLYNNDILTTKPQVFSYISLLRSAAAEAGLYDYIATVIGWDLLNNLYCYLPTDTELLTVSPDHLPEYLDNNYPDITYHKK